MAQILRQRRDSNRNGNDERNANIAIEGEDEMPTDWQERLTFAIHFFSRRYSLLHKWIDHLFVFLELALSANLCQFPVAPNLHHIARE